MATTTPAKSGRIPRATALELSRRFLRALRGADVVAGTRGSCCVFAGSLRRKSATVGDLDLLLVDRTDAQWANLAHVRRFTLSKFGPRLAQGVFAAKVHGVDVFVKIDIRRVAARSLGAALEYFTGPRGHNLGMRTKAKKRGYKLNEYGLFAADGTRVAGRTEKEIYDVLGHGWKPPEQRGKR